MIDTARNLPPGAEIGFEGYAIGRDPRAMSPNELRAAGHEPMSPTAAIRAHCLDCCAGSADEVRRCMALRCPSWPFRMGKSPWKAARQLSEEQRAAARDRIRSLNAAKTTPAPVNLTSGSSASGVAATPVAPAAKPARSADEAVAP